MCGIGRAIFGTQGDGSLVIMEAKKRGEIHLAFAMYRSKCAVFRQKFFFKNCREPQCLCGFKRLLCYYNTSLYSTNYSCCFHIFTPFLYSEMCQKPSIYAGFRDLLVYSNYTSPKPILPLFSFVPVGHKGLEDLGRVVVFVLC